MHKRIAARQGSYLVSRQISNGIFFEELGIVALGHAHLPAVTAVILLRPYKPATSGHCCSLCFACDRAA